MRCSGSIVSTVAMKLAKGSGEHFHAIPLAQTFWREQRVLSVASEHQTRDQVEVASGFGLPSKLTSFETPIVLLIVRHGAKSDFTLTNIYPGNRGFRSLTKREAFLRVIFCMAETSQTLAGASCVRPGDGCSA